MKKKFLSFLVLLGFTMSVFAQPNGKSANDLKGAQVGQTVKDFSAIDQNGKKFNLNAALKEGPVVLIFYRGEWCPICNRHLSQLQDSLKYVQEKGAQVIAISPEKPEYHQKMSEKTGAKFTLLYDENYAIANAFDVTFTPAPEMVAMLKEKLGADLKAAHGSNDQQLPVPATFIIDKNKKITWRQFDPDYKNRASVADIIANIPSK